MKIEIEQKDLSAVLTKVVGVINKRNTIPILANVLISADDNIVTIRATDLDIEAASSIECKVIEPGETTVPASLISNIVKKYETGPIEIIEGGNRVTIRQGASKFDLSTLPAAEYPNVFTGEYDASFELGSDEIKRIFGKAMFAVSNEEFRYYLKGIYFHPTKRGLTAVATDGVVLAKTWTDFSEDFTGVIVPKKTVETLLKVITCGPIRVSVGMKSIMFDAGETTITSKVVDGAFPDYTRVIPQDNNDIFTVGAETFIDAVKRVSVVCAGGQNSQIKLSIRDGVIQISVSGTTNNAEEYIDADTNGDHSDILLNPLFLSDILAQCTGGDVSFAYTASQNSPVIITSTKDDKFLSVIMPMRSV